MMNAAGRYFSMRDNVYIEGRWHLVDPTDKDGASLRGVFRSGKPASAATPIKLHHSKFAERGVPVDYVEIDNEIVPVVHVRVAEILANLAPGDVEVFPVVIDEASGQYCIVNVITVRRCIDEAASAYISKYAEEDRDVFPDKVGSYFRVSGLKIDKSQVQGARVFRTWGWGAIIVAEEIKIALETAHVTGVKFVEV